MDGEDKIIMSVKESNSPQAKDRIEQLFGTFQDRLVKEMRLARVRTLEQANGFLGHYLKTYKRRFGVKPADAVDFHRPRPTCLDLEGILCLKNHRVLHNDFTISYKGTLDQIEEAMRGKKVVLEERLNGTLYITYKGQKLRYHKIMTRPIQVKQPVDKKKKSLIYKPPTDHPWSLPYPHNYKKRLQTMNQ